MKLDSPLPARRYRFGIFEVDLKSGEVRKAGIRIRLQSQPFEVLVMLLTQPGEIVTREELQKKLWPTDIFVDFDHGMNTAINKLRDALSDSADTPRYIETLPRRGYRFIAAVESAGLAEPEIVNVPSDIMASVSEDASGGTGSDSRRRLNVAFVAALMIVVLSTATGLTIYGFRTRTNKVSIKSIAVLPLASLSGDPAQDFFADGMTEQLTTDLGKISALRVISRTSAMRFKGTQMPMPEIGRVLGVDAVVEGTVTRSGNHVRVTANLVQILPEKHLWAESFEGELGDVLVLQEEMAESIARAVRVKLTPSEERNANKTATVDPQAYEAYLKGKYYSSKFTPADEKKAVSFFQQAIQKDPNYALAYTSEATAFAILGNMDDPAPREAFPKAEALVQKALQLDGDLPEAHETRAWNVLYYDWNFPKARAEFEYALQLNPNLSGSHQGYAWYFTAMGRFEDAIVEIRRARDLDPLSLIVNSDYCWILYYARRYDEALAQCNATLDLDPHFSIAHYVLMYIYLAKQMNLEAYNEDMKLGWEYIPPATRTAMQKAFDAGGPGAAWDEWYARSRPTLESDVSSPFVLAKTYMFYKNKERAFYWLEKSYEQREFRLIYLGVAPEWDSLRGDPRFVDLMRRVGLPQANARK